MDNKIYVLCFIVGVSAIVGMSLNTTIAPRGLKEFDSVKELEVWLLDNDIDNNTYITDTYDCDDFALDLVNDAIQEGYAIYSMGSGTVYYKTTIMYNTNNETFYYGKEFVRLSNHAYCVTKINGIWYQIEPQDDGITELGKEF